VSHLIVDELDMIKDGFAFLDRHGYAILPSIFSDRDIEGISNELECALHVDDAAVRAGDAVYAARDLLRLCPAVKTWWSQPSLVNFVCSVLGPSAGLVRGLLFDKPPEQTWAVPWHKDRSIVIQNPAIFSDRYSPPRSKAGLWHCEPPESVLERMLSLRIHLDPSTADNGPLSVVAGSHRDGERGEVVCLLANRGDVLAMRPLIDHSSPRSESGATQHRRVIHLEFAADPQLPDGYQWHEFHPVRASGDAA
jgi:hypothetical protein